MNNYYFLAENIKPKTAIACKLGGTPLSHELIPSIIGKPVLEFELFLRSKPGENNDMMRNEDLSELKYTWLDYQPNNLAWPLMSERMKNLVVSHLTGMEEVVWIKVKINGLNEVRDYHIPCFINKLDVLDVEKTIFVKGTSHIIKPVFSLNKIVNFAMFHAPYLHWEITSALYVCESLMNVFKEQKLTGLAFERIVAV
jgi:hypothetical protein